jgi:hypothetical protein
MMGGGVICKIESAGTGEAMDMHEYQAKELLSEFGVAVPRRRKS